MNFINYPMERSKILSTIMVMELMVLHYRGEQPQRLLV
ncbi:hypothetical protein BLA29_006848 [Euroglyphus maynei]|uniref:Uncharacterized protein n=1 Tax=Euroglyphus maynei TaxID=6958 RepID=A0A1Y3B3F8_EURMA|nr:hypothetical protein BLA29_006848 [Euroglyphus maynei]